MIPKTKKLFISYRSSDHREVDFIAEQLRSLKHEDGTRKFTTWQDKHDLEAGKSWWDGIIDAIIDCDMFVFHLSSDYLDSAVCMAELNYAVERGRPIIPVVLESAYYTSPRTRKPDIEFWGDIPDWLSKYQFLFYNDHDFLERFERAVAVYEANWPPDIEIRRPLNPDANAIHGNNYAVYATATERALQVAFNEAKPLFRELVQRNDPDFADICRQWLTLMDRYQDLLDAKRHHAPRVVFQRKWDEYVALFPLDFVDDLYPDADDQPIIFDPNNLSKGRHQPKKARQAATPSPQGPLDMAVVEAEAPAKPTSLSLMPAPFAWIEIPGGRGTMKTNESGVTLTIPTEKYWISKYHITNAQFAKFIEAGGYRERRWWTDAGWEAKTKGWVWDSKQSKFVESHKAWTEPRYWNDSKWNGAEQPVVGVSWYEAVAFCLWLSEETGEKMMLPTEDQWQYAAQGDDGRAYPWGDKWDPKRCNNNVGSKGIGKTTPVRQYEGKGDSPFGVVDMAGNVWEWCLTDYANKTNVINRNDTFRVLRGGSWSDLNSDLFRCGGRVGGLPHGWGGGRGFRVSRSYA